MELDAVSLNATAQALLSGRDNHAARSSSSLPPNPFVGLRPFESGEGLLFFGRREQIVELLQQLHRTRFLSIVGSSGCGKSSLIRAGLIPKLKAGFLIEDRDQWLKATMKPGDAPLYNLALAILGAFSDETPPDAEVKSLVEEIEVSGLHALVERLTPRLANADTNFLLLVDQFEEIFRFGSYAEADDADAAAPAGSAKQRVEATDRERRRDEAAEFVSLMLGLVQQKTLPIYVVMTMRSDFLGDCDAFYGLPQAMNRSQYLVPRLTRQQRQEAIENPIRLYGAKLAPRLLDRLLNDVGDESDQLPVMQHALMRTWEEWQRTRSGAIDIPHYEAVGTIKDALWRDADKALAGMTERELTITGHLFQALTDVDAQGRRLRRPAKFSEVQAITGASAEEVDKIVERFQSDNRSFLTKSSERREDDALIDISHESLIRQWKTLRDWVDAEAESREQYTRLAGAALRYYAPARTDCLWSDPPLQLALDWREKHEPNETWARRYHPAYADAMKFLDESLAKREADAAEMARLLEADAQRMREEVERTHLYAEQQLKSARRLRWLTVGLLVFSVLAAGTATFAAIAWTRAKRAEIAAQANLELARDSEKRAQEEGKRALNKEMTVKELYEELSKSLEGEKREKEKAEGFAKRLSVSLDETKKATEIAKARAAEAVKAQLAAQAGKKALEDSIVQLNETQKKMLATQNASQTYRDANKAYNRAKLNEAKVKFRAAIQNYYEINDLDGVAFTNAEVGDMLIEQEDKDEQRRGLTYLEQASSVYRQSGDLESSASTLIKIGHVLLKDATSDEGKFPSSTPGAESSAEKDKVQAARKEKLVRVLEKYCSALEGFKSARNLEGQIKAYTAISGFFIMFDDDIEVGNDCPALKAALADKPEDDVVKRPVRRVISAYSETLPLYRQLIREQVGDQAEVSRLRKDLIEILMMLGNLYNSMEEPQSTREVFETAVAIYRETGESEKEGELLTEIGRFIRASSGEGAEADKYLLRAVEAYHRAGNAGAEADVLRQIGHYASIRPLKEGDSIAQKQQKPLDFLNRAIVIYGSLKDWKKQVETYQLIASMQERTKQFAEALQTYRHMLSLHEPENDLLGQASIHKHIAELQEKQGNYAEAIESFTKAIELGKRGGQGMYSESLQPRIDALRAKLKEKPEGSPKP